MNQPQISTVEGGGSVLTLPLLTRLAKALDAVLTVELAGDSPSFVFRPCDTSGGVKDSVA